MRSPKAVFFDIDDTLLNHSAAEHTALKMLLTANPPTRNVPMESYLRSWRAISQTTIEKYLSAKLSFEGQRIERIKTFYGQFGSALNENRAQSLSSSFVCFYEAASVLFPDVRDTLDSLSPHFVLGIITNGNTPQQRTKLATAGILDRFACVLTSEDAGVTKPDVRIFQQACEQMHLHPSEAVYVGDRYEVDILGARAAGLGAVWINRSGVPVAGHDCPSITSLEQLTELLVQVHVAGADLI